MMLLAWLLPGVHFIPAMCVVRILVLHYHGYSYTVCRVDWSLGINHKAYATVTSILYIIIPCCTVMCCNYMTFRFIKAAAANVSLGDRAEAKDKANLRLLKMFTLKTMIYIICYSPWAAAVLIRTKAHVSSTVYNATVMIAYTAAAVNPILYGLFNNNLRAGLHNLLHHRGNVIAVKEQT